MRLCRTNHALLVGLPDSDFSQLPMHAGRSAVGLYLGLDMRPVPPNSQPHIICSLRASSSQRTLVESAPLLLFTTMTMSDITAHSSENLGPALVAIAWVFAAFSAIVIAFRIYVRLKITNRFQIDDWLILFTFVGVYPVPFSMVADG
jgi:hypothetical protein